MSLSKMLLMSLFDAFKTFKFFSKSPERFFDDESVQSETRSPSLTSNSSKLIVGTKSCADSDSKAFDCK